jgi:NhaP-type Na+/H+ or K+/H+ antiporter
LTSERLRRWHKMLFLVWIGPGNVTSVALVLFTGQKIILVWNLVVSMYTVAMEHFLGMRNEDQNDS